MSTDSRLCQNLRVSVCLYLNQALKESVDMLTALFLGSHIGYERVYKRSSLCPHNSPSVKDSSVCEETRVLSGSGEISDTPVKFGHTHSLHLIIITTFNGEHMELCKHQC